MESGGLTFKLQELVHGLWEGITRTACIIQDGLQGFVKVFLRFDEAVRSFRLPVRIIQG